MIPARTFLVVCSLLASAALAGAQTITVTTPLDVVDVPLGATVADLPGPDGKVSFKEALRASDNTPGHQTIGFAIPEDDWYLSSIFPGQVLLQTSFNWSAQQPVTIDGTTQTAFTGDTYPDGHELMLGGPDLYLNGDESELFGFHESDVSIAGDGSTVHDCTGGMYITIGAFNSGCTVYDNEADTIRVLYADDNVIVRNTTRRVRITGLNDTDKATGNRVGGPDPADRNFITGWGNVGEHGNPAGDTVELYYAEQTLIQNNYIGTTPDGMAIGNHASTAGIAVYSGNQDLVVRDNLIAIQSHFQGGTTGPAGGAGIYLDVYEGATGVEILGNTIGLDATGAAVLGGAEGIRVNAFAFEFPCDIRIGGTAPGEGNVIAGHESTGILMFNGPGIPALGHVRVSGNSIHSNDVIGIELMPDTWTFGPTANDVLDADEGANGLQNHPVIASATLAAGSLHVAGTLNSTPLGQFAIELFASPACDASGFGQGEVFVGATTLFTDASGNGAFDETFPSGVPVGWVVTATATDEATGWTSEFGACAPITSGGTPSFCDASDASLAACPCGNAGSPDSGCDLPQGTGGVSLAVVAQTTSPNSATLTGTGFPASGSPTALVVRSSMPNRATPLPFGDGVMCLEGSSGLVRLAATTATSGASTHVFGNGAAAGPGVQNYQLWFRSTPSTFCMPSSFNMSNGCSLTW